jgi:hypothetical protein
VSRRNYKVELLKRVPLFADCSRGELEQIAQIADELDLAEGKNLTAWASPAANSSSCSRARPTSARTAQIINTLGAGDFFGEIALVEDSLGRRRSRDDAVRVLVITDRAFRQLLEKQPELQRKVLSRWPSA